MPHIELLLQSVRAYHPHVSQSTKIDGSILLTRCSRHPCEKEPSRTILNCVHKSYAFYDKEVYVGETNMFQVDYNQRIVFFDVEQNKGFELNLYFDDGSTNIGRGIIDITAVLRGQKGQTINVPLYSYEQPEDQFGASFARVIINDYVCPYEYEDRVKAEYANVHYVAPPPPLPKSQCRIKANRIRSERESKRKGALAKDKKKEDSNGERVEQKEEASNNAPVKKEEEVKQSLVSQELNAIKNAQQQFENMEAQPQVENDEPVEFLEPPELVDPLDEGRTEKGVQATENNLYSGSDIDAKIEALSTTNPDVRRLSQNMDAMKKEIDGVIDDVNEMISETDKGTDLDL